MATSCLPRAPSCTQHGQAEDLPADYREGQDAWTTSRTRRRTPDNPGWYFHPLPGVNSWDVHGTEMLVWGNYCNVLGGAAPVNIYYSTDKGRP